VLPWACQKKLVRSGQTICVVHLIQSRDKRAKSPPTKDSIPSSRALDHRSRKEATLFSLQIQPNSDNSAGHLSFPGKFRLLVEGNLWMTWSQVPSTIPLYILDALAHAAGQQQGRKLTFPQTAVALC
jgi:hypothetical protein